MNLTLSDGDCPLTFEYRLICWVLRLTVTPRIAVVVLAGGPSSSALSEEIQLDNTGNWRLTLILHAFQAMLSISQPSFCPPSCFIFFPPTATREEFSPTRFKEPSGQRTEPISH